MTKSQFGRKLDALLEERKAALRRKALELFRSGGVEAFKYDDDFALPVIVLRAAWDSCAPHVATPEYREACAALTRKA